MCTDPLLVSMSTPVGELTFYRLIHTVSQNESNLNAGTSINTTICSDKITISPRNLKREFGGCLDRYVPRGYLLKVPRTARIQNVDKNK